MSGPTYDFIIVGGGPVGLHAALKAAVLNHTVLLVDKGSRFSRVAQADRLANIPGAPGISGEDLLSRGRDDIRAFEKLAGKRLVTAWEETEATAVERADGGVFRLLAESAAGRREALGRALVLATGVVDAKPGIEAFHRRGHATLAPLLAREEIGYCVLCEGWALDGKRVAVIGSRDSTIEIALDIARHFSGDVTLVTDGGALDGEDVAARLREARVRIDARPVARLVAVEGDVGVELEDGAVERFDKAFLDFGWFKAANELAVALGARVTRDGQVVTDANGQAIGADGEPIRGLYAVGDLRAGRWKQIVVGWGDAEHAVISAYADHLAD